MKNSFFNLPENTSAESRAAFQVALVIAVTHFLAAPYYYWAFVQPQTNSVRFLTLTAMTISLGILFVISATSSQHRKPAPGILIALGIWAVAYPLASTLIAGLGLVLGIAIIFAGPMCAWQVLPRKLTWPTIAITVVSGLVSIWLDVFGAATRPALPGFYLHILMAAMAILLAVFAVRRTQERSSYITIKLLTPTLFFLFIMLAGLITYNWVVSVQQIDKSELERLETARNIFTGQINDIATLATGLVTPIASDEQVQAAFAARNRELLTSLTLPAFESVKKDFDVKQYQFALPPATSFLRLHNLKQFDDDLSSVRATFVEANTQKKTVKGVEIGRNGFGVRGVVPVFYQGEHIGVLEAGIDLGTDFLQTFKQQYGLDTQIILDEKAMQVAIMIVPPDAIGPKENLTLHASTLSEPFFASESNYIQALSGVSEIEHVRFNNREYAIYSTPLYDFSGKIIGVLDIISDHSAVAQQQNAQTLVSIGTLLFTLIFIGLALSYFVTQTLRPIGELTNVAIAISSGDLNQQAKVQSNDEIGVLASTFNKMTGQLRDFIASLESRVAERTRNLELAAEVGRTVSQVRALDVMLKDAAELIRAQFDLYYVQVYLVNPAQTHLVLQAGTGEVGAALLARKHQLPLNTGSINGRAAVEKRPEVISDTANSSVFKPNPLLPNTRSEMAVPLLVSDQVVGVLDMQGDQAGSLNPDMLPAFEALAGQLAIAIKNANLLAEAEQARAEVEAQARRAARANWQDYLDSIHRPEQIGYVFEEGQVLPLEREAVLQEESNALTAPISFTGEQLGSLVVDMELLPQTPQTVELVNIVARQVAQQIENLRLLESAERYRFEAEQAARRLTREGWEEYFNAKTGQSLGYLYDLKEVKPIESQTGLAAEAALTVPVRVRDETIGKLAVLDVDATDPETLELVNIVSERLSEHIESLRLLEETQRGQVELNKRARQLAAVSKISTVSSRELDIQKMLATVVQMAQREFGLYHAHVFTYNEHANHLEIVACGWKEGDEHEGTHGTTVIPFDQEQSLVARAARTRQPVVINDVRSEPGWLPNPMLPDTHSELAVPLVIGEEVLGVLDVQSDRLNAFSDEDINIQATLAAQVATALQNARNYERARRQAEREAMLNAISQKIQSATSVEAVLQIAARELGHALGAPRTIAQLSLKDKN